MNCCNHPEREAVASCITCGGMICEECDVLVAGKHHCKKCLAEADRAPMGIDVEIAGEGHTERPVKKWTRSVTDRYLTGVCGGFAEYSDLDPSLVRILFVVIALVTAILPCLVAYFIAAMVIPSDEP